MYGAAWITANVLDIREILRAPETSRLALVPIPVRVDE
jgi:hypothetical protein